MTICRLRLNGQRDRFSIKTDITVSHIAAVVAALFHGLGSVPLASEYRAFLHALLSLPAEGEDAPADDYMQSATGADGGDVRHHCPPIVACR